MASKNVLPPIRLNRIAANLLGLCVLAMPSMVHAANECPWLNEATASGLLGGSAVGEFAGVAGQPAVCTFTQHEAGGTRTLQITIEVATDPHSRLAALIQSCGTRTEPLTAIGNESVACALDPRRKTLGERAFGRVRDQVFTITLSSSLKGDPVLNEDALKTRIYTAAEQVAGNLF
ncbi:MAG TPA: hypothetical protein VK716_08620 [Terracidiphilus sp.]|jgi:hypothetical protein|nr:hypothetical protein [Terracidiphilus sp.]